MKLIFSLSNTEGLNKYTIDSEENLKIKLKELKSEIDNNHSHMKYWDKYKKYANDYELIYTDINPYPYVSSITPISRSYFKLWEILHDFELEFNFKNAHSIRATFLAEGPGGFVQSFMNYRKFKKNNDRYYGMTLLPKENTNIPMWKMKPSSLFTYYNGVDNTGSLYNKENIRGLVKHVGGHTCDLVTADGGFDFSNDYNNQEQDSFKLILCEVITGLSLLKQNGVFILKTYDIHTQSTKNLLFMLYTSFKDIHIVKPCTSRPANSEKYLVCIGLKKNVVANILGVLYSWLDTTDYESKCYYENNELFKKNIVMFNCLYILEQVRMISKILHFIDNGIDDIDACIKQQYVKCKKWCQDYNISLSHKSIKYGI